MLERRAIWATWGCSGGTSPALGLALDARQARTQGTALEISLTRQSAFNLCADITTTRHSFPTPTSTSRIWKAKNTSPV
jgi:hypothetical protein